MDETQRLLDLGRKLRTQVRGPIFDYIDGTLQILALETSGANCPACEARRKAKTEAQRKWRSKGKGPSPAIDGTQVQN